MLPFTYQILSLSLLYFWQGICQIEAHMRLQTKIKKQGIQALTLLLLFMGLFSGANAQVGEEPSRFVEEKDWAGWKRAIHYPDTIKKIYVDYEDESFHVDSLYLFPNMTGLILDGPEVTGLSFINGLPKLKVLEFHETGLESLEGLDTLKYLEEFEANGCEISDLAPLKGMKQLKKLNLYFNNITDLSPLEEMDQLTRIDLGRNPITDIEPLWNMTNLTWFSVYKCENLRDLTNIKYFTQLTDLNISFVRPNSNFSLKLIDGHDKLQNLRVQGMVKNDKELTYIADKVLLEQLTMGRNDSITTLDSLYRLKNLVYLDIHSDNIEDISVMENFPMLIKLVAYKNRIHDVGPLLQCDLLTSLFIHENPIEDLVPLLGMSQLEYLHLSKGKLSEEDVKKLHRVLGECEISLY